MENPYTKQLEENRAIRERWQRQADGYRTDIYDLFDKLGRLTFAKYADEYVFRQSTYYGFTSNGMAKDYRKQRKSFVLMITGIQNKLNVITSNIDDITEEINELTKKQQELEYIAKSRCDENGN